MLTYFKTSWSCLNKKVLYIFSSKIMKTQKFDALAESIFKTNAVLKLMV